MPETYAIVWCDSPLGLISTRVDSSGAPVVFHAQEIPPEIEKCILVDTVFDILNRKDGTKIAVPYASLFIFFNWEF